MRHVNWSTHQRAIAACFALTFASLLIDMQIVGLLGSLGVQPAKTVVELIGHDKPWRFPTIFSYVEPSDENLHFAVICGVAASTIAVWYGWPQALLVAWVIFLSLCTVGGEFFAYPWDGLLLEAGALAMLLDSKPGAMACFANRFLAFRLQWGMGLQKFYATGQNDWWRGTYLDTFYAWQPMPTPVAWYVHNLGHEFHWASTRVVLVSQLVLPLGVFGSRRVRVVTSAIFVLEQLWIQATGNYGIFNLLTIALCTLPITEPIPAARPGIATGLASISVLGGSFLLVRRLLVGMQTTHYPWLSAMTWLYDDEHAFGILGTPMEPVFLLVVSILRMLAPFRVCNDYGIFRTGIGSASKKVTRFLGRTFNTSAFVPLVLPTGFHQATSGITTINPNGSLIGWFAPHQPRLDHSFFYNGIGMNIGAAIMHEQYHLQPVAHPRAFLRHVERALLRCRTDANSPAKRLFAYVPSDLDALMSRTEDCRFSGNAPHTTSKQMWLCTHKMNELKHLEKVPVVLRPVSEVECTDSVFGYEEKAWIRFRRDALRAGLKKEAELRRPSVVAWGVAAGAIVAIAAQGGRLQAVRRVKKD